MNLRLLCLLCAFFVAWVPARSLYAQSLGPEADFRRDLGEFDQALGRTELGAQVERCVVLFASLKEGEKKACEELRNALKRLLQEPTFCHGKTITEPNSCAALGDDCLTCCTQFEHEERCKQLVCRPLNPWPK